MQQSKESERRRLRPGRICVAIQAATPAEMISRAEAALRESKFLEFRLDSLSTPAAVLPSLRRFLARNQGVIRDCHLQAPVQRRQFQRDARRATGNPAQGRARRLPHGRSRDRIRRRGRAGAIRQVPCRTLSIRRRTHRQLSRFLAHAAARSSGRSHCGVRS